MEDFIKSSINFININIKKMNKDTKLSNYSRTTLLYGKIGIILVLIGNTGMAFTIKGNFIISFLILLIGSLLGIIFSVRTLLENKRRFEDFNKRIGEINNEKRSDEG
jgi:low temperature requirement protein LtrA